MNTALLAAVNEDRYRTRLAELVGVDSGSDDPAGVNRVAEHVLGYCRQAGLRADRVPVPGHGDAVVARRRGTGTARVLLAAHMDTVFPAGTAAARPFRIENGRAYGPGVCDDKGGLLAGLAAVEALIHLDAERYGEVVLLCTPDEEIGSPGSRPLLHELARQADVALCLECARENGDLVSARKGMADVEVTLRGRAAHAGIEPERGANAALAAARLTVAFQALNGALPGVTVNVGVIQAGSAPNVVADQARLLVDLRAERAADFDAALERIRHHATEHGVSGVTTDTTVHAPTPPWERSPGTTRLAELARRAGTRVGLPVADTATGGCADANLLAATGLPVLDGLGPVGGDDHSPDEWLDLTSVVPRVALLAELITLISD